MKIAIILSSLIVSLFLETTVLSLPLVLLTIFLLAVLFQEQWIFTAAFFIGIFLDILTFHTVGGNSIFFLCMLGVVFLYKRKYEIQSMPFILTFSFISSLLYGFVFLKQNVFVETILSVLLCGGIFFLLHAFNRKSTKNFSMPSN